MGHNAGEHLLKGMPPTDCGVSFLLGCSSARPRPAGVFDPLSPALAYLVAGCAAVVGNLWDVTDGDLDRFAKSLLHKVVDSDASISAILPAARRACKLRYLVGAAPVYFGLPGIKKKGSSRPVSH
jgi:separase